MVRIPGANGGLLNAAELAIAITPQPTSGVLAALAAAEELAKCRSLAALLRRAVELARDSLGLELVSLYLTNDTHDTLVGSFSTNASGALLDERHLQRPCGAVEREAHRRAEAGTARWLHLRDSMRVPHEGRPCSPHGWQIVTPVRSLRAPIGVLYNEGEHGGPDGPQQISVAVFASLLGGLIELLREPAPLVGLPHAGARYGVVVRKAIALLNEEPTISSRKLAARLSVGYARLSQAFRVELQVSLPQYRNRLRLERFLGLVEHEGGNICNAASSAGFGSYAQFYRIFRQHLGVTPRQYLTGRAAL